MKTGTTGEEEAGPNCKYGSSSRRGNSDPYTYSVYSTWVWNTMSSNVIWRDRFLRCWRPVRWEDIMHRVEDKGQKLKCLKTPAKKFTNFRFKMLTSIGKWSFLSVTLIKVGTSVDFNKNFKGFNTGESKLFQCSRYPKYWGAKYRDSHARQNTVLLPLSEKGVNFCQDSNMNDGGGHVRRRQSYFLIVK